MSKFCPLADAVTNCTDNCKSCLEEEMQTNDIEIADCIEEVEHKC